MTQKLLRLILLILEDPSPMERLQRVLANIPLPLVEVIPNPQEVVEQKHELDTKLQQMRSLGQSRKVAVTLSEMCLCRCSSQPAS